MRITSKGQVTIPKSLRERYGLEPETDVKFVERDGLLALVPAEFEFTIHASGLLLRHLREAPHKPITTDEIMNLTRGQDYV